MRTLRLAMIRWGSTGAMRWRMLLATAILVLLQVAVVSHQVGHSAAGDGAGCAICLTAGGTSGTAPPAAIALPFFQATTSVVVASVAAPPAFRPAASHRARAPPVST